MIISRLTTAALTFAVLAGASLALAATVPTAAVPTATATATATAIQPPADASAVRPVRIIELPRVVVVAKRLPA